MLFSWGLKKMPFGMSLFSGSNHASSEDERLDKLSMNGLKR
jgi:hypothetical protein